MRVWEINGGFGPEFLRRAERKLPEPGPGEALVRIRAASLNFRDHLTLYGQYNPKQKLPLIPLSDAAGEVAAIGPGVAGLQAGDRVVANFFRDWQAGRPTSEKLAYSMGVPDDGVLCEYRLFPAGQLLPMPAHLNFAEAAALTCAGLTAWSAIVTLGRVSPGEHVLIQGTGGVALFALQFAKLAGAVVTVTSSSDDKLARAKALGADHLINYRGEPAWGKAALALTGGRGLDHIVEVGGADTLGQSVRAIRIGGTISLIGVLSGAAHPLHLPLVVMRQVRLQGVTVGSREGFAAMLRAIGQARLKPVVDTVFAFEDAPGAYNRMAEGAQFGKIVVEI